MAAVERDWDRGPRVESLGTWIPSKLQTSIYFNSLQLSILFKIIQHTVSCPFTLPPWHADLLFLHIAFVSGHLKGHFKNAFQSFQTNPDIIDNIH